jgi:hypothetical protein
VAISTLEYDLKKDLDTVMKRLKKFCKFSDMWVGITGNNRFCFINGNTISSFQKLNPSTMSLLAWRTRNEY